MNIQLSPGLLNEQQLAIRWQISPKTLRNLRVSGGSVRFVRVAGGRSVRYRMDDVVAWEEAHAVQSTSQQGAR